jgi:hypothetical protein
MNLVDEDDGAAPEIAPSTRLGHHLAEILHAGEDGRQRHEARLPTRPLRARGRASIGGARHEARDRGLAAARGAPQDHGGQLPGFDQRPQRRVRTQQMLLSDDVVERARAHAVGEGRFEFGPIPRRHLEQVACFTSGHAADASGFGPCQRLAPTEAGARDAEALVVETAAPL